MHTYQATLDYLYSFIDAERRPAATAAEAQLNVERAHVLLRALGDPQAQLPAVVVAGTKGKGSTCAMVESIARAAGYRTGLWTSPHLNSYRERIQVERTLISQEELVVAVDRLRPIVERFDSARYGQPTTFQLGFALALRYFAERGVQIAVLEVGMGGRYDAVNAITPLVSAVSSISYDHVHVLGHTLAAIADNKAGIMKPAVPAVTVPQQPEAAAVLAHEAATVGAPLWLAGEAALARQDGPATHPKAPGRSGVQTRVSYPVPPEPALLRGPFQRENARLALGTAMLLRERGLPISETAMSAGLHSVRWPGRLELAAEQPLIVLDGAHNGDSAVKLATALRAEFRFERLVLVLGTSRDKDIAGIVAGLVPHADALVLTRARYHRAQADLDLLAAAARPHLRGPLVLTGNVAEALDEARARAGPHDLICVTGSLFVVGDAREALGLTVSE